MKGRLVPPLDSWHLIFQPSFSHEALSSHLRTINQTSCDTLAFQNFTFFTRNTFHVHAAFQTNINEYSKIKTVFLTALFQCVPILRLSKCLFVFRINQSNCDKLNFTLTNVMIWMSRQRDSPAIHFLHNLLCSVL